MVQIYSVLSNAYKLDGGAMFGNAPKPVWERWHPADEQNRINLATRGFLAITAKEKILFEAGIGAYMEPKLRDRFGVQESEHRLLKSLAERGLSPDDITHIFISHLHFDHAGGLLSAWQEGREPELLFPNARIYIGEEAWKRATHPHPRDRASFIPALHAQLEKIGRLSFVKKGDFLTLGDLDLRFFPSEGHTPGLLCPDLRYPGGRLVFPSDLVSGRAWVHLPISMGYDRYPELLIDEKKALLTSLAAEDAWLFYVHDPEMAASKVKYDEEYKTFVAIDAQKDLVIGVR
jgi:glyoxylase-like metal-dependent hydrolase (beta-lactamase superfamily II)